MFFAAVSAFRTVDRIHVFHIQGEDTGGTKQPQAHAVEQMPRRRVSGLVGSWAGAGGTLENYLLNRHYFIEIPSCSHIMWGIEHLKLSPSVQFVVVD